MEKHLTDLAIDRKIVLKEIVLDSQNKQQVVYASQYYQIELHTAQMLHELNVKDTADKEILREKIKRIQRAEKIDLDEKQQEAIMEAVKNGLLVITGGPGTGKTTTINAIIRYFEMEGLDIYLAAPTGRAAKRMTEATGYEAKTIHRLLELSGVPEESSAGVHFERNAQNPLEADVIIIDEMSMVDIFLMGVHFERNAQNPLEADVIIIDEMSMVDIFLMHALLSAVVTGTRLILVGDVNQLPSVGPGSVLKDIIHSGEFPVVELTKIFRQASQSDIVRLILVGDVNQLPSVGPGSVLKDIIHSGEFPVVELTKIFRQASQSDIVVNAHKINEGVPVVLDNKSMDFFFLKRYDANVIISVVITLIQKKLPKFVEAQDFFFLKRYDANVIISVVITLIQKKLPKFVEAQPYDIQVLTPMRKGLLGVERLNKILQQYLNPPEQGKTEREHGSGLFREGDKVMQIKNNYQIEWEIRGLYGIPVENMVQDCSVKVTRSCRLRIIIRLNGKFEGCMVYLWKKVWEFLTETQESYGKLIPLQRQLLWNLTREGL